MPLNTQPGVPHKGWTLSGVTDLQLDEGRAFGEYEDCEFCGHEQIRYVHTLTHREHPDAIRVGCICAEHLTEDYVNPRQREGELRNRAARRDHWPRRAWKKSAKGNLYLTTPDDHHVIVFPARGGFMLRIDDKPGRKVYPTKLAAQLASFDYLYLSNNSASPSRPLRPPC